MSRAIERNESSSCRPTTGTCRCRRNKDYVPKFLALSQVGWLPMAYGATWNPIATPLFRSGGVSKAWTCHGSPRWRNDEDELFQLTRLKQRTTLGPQHLWCRFQGAIAHQHPFDDEA